MDALAIVGTRVPHYICGGGHLILFKTLSLTSSLWWSRTGIPEVKWVSIVLSFNFKSSIPSPNGPCGSVSGKMAGTALQVVFSLLLPAVLCESSRF